MMFLSHHHLWRALGASLFICGLAGDCIVAVLLVARGMPRIFFWHFPLALIWAMGVNFLTLSGEQQEGSPFISLHKWGITALLLGAGTFPGLGSCAYSIAFLVTRCLFTPATMQGRVNIEPDIQAAWSPVEVSSPEQKCMRPLVDDLREEDTEVRRAAVARLSREANSNATRLLRELLSDSKAEVRSDASVALVRLDDEMSRTLHASFEEWNANPADIGLTLALVDQYYQYAASNVLDEKSQHFYLVLARDLLLGILGQEGVRDAQLWLKLARVRQSLGELPEALDAACVAVQIQPDDSDASLLAADLAFRTHAWGTLTFLMKSRTSLTSSHPYEGASQSLQWWVAPSQKLC